MGKINKQIILFMILCLMFMVSCGKKENEGEALKKYCIEFVSEYNVLEEYADGRIKVSIIAPDFVHVIAAIKDENEKVEITPKNLEKGVKKHIEFEKEYIFYSNVNEINDVEKAFLQEIAYDLVIDAIKNIEYTERWDMKK